MLNNHVIGRSLLFLIMMAHIASSAILPATLALMIALTDVLLALMTLIWIRIAHTVSHPIPVLSILSSPATSITSLLNMVTGLGEPATTVNTLLFSFHPLQLDS